MSCILVGSLLTIAPPLIQKTIDSFQGLPNRLEWVGEAEGVRFYNDSKATNVDAAVKALTGFQGPLILIAGGRHKGAEYAPLVRAAKGKVKKAVFLGEAKGLLAASFREVVPFEVAEDMEDAVSIAFGSAEKGDTVLLAPACSSFDMYSDYAQRGRAFKVAVKRLLNG
jgi:UDP-N-acetylmuramoylalanine--D-glutamate ligase